MSRVSKEAVVFCIDVGIGMLDSPVPGTSSLALAFKVASMLIQRKIFAQSKDEIALVLFGTPDTSNQLADNDAESYCNISVVFPLGVSNFDLLQYFSKGIPELNSSADFLDALTVSLDILYNNTREKFFSKRRIALFTNFAHNFSDDNVDGIINGFKSDDMDVELSVIGPELSNSGMSVNRSVENGQEQNQLPGCSSDADRHQSITHSNKKPQTKQQLHGQQVVTLMLSSDVVGTIYSFNDLLKTISGFEKRSVSSAAWKCQLTLGNDLSIPCVAYAKTKEAKPTQTWKKCHAQTVKSEDVMRNHYYFLDNEQRTEVSKQNLAKGYKYGKDIVPFSAEDEKQLKFISGEKRLTILGFTDISNVPVYFHVDDQAHRVLPEIGDKDAAIALSALVSGLKNQNLCAIATYVYRKGSNPKLVALFPCPTVDHHFLTMLGIPFAEDIRMLQFPPLPQSNPNQSNQIKGSLLQKFINEANLQENDQHDELFKPENMPNPHFQHTFECLSHRISEQNEMPSLNTAHLQCASYSNPTTLMLTQQLKACYKLEKEIAEDNPKPKPSWKNVETDPTLQDGKKVVASIIPLSEIVKEDIHDVGSVSPHIDFEIILSRNLAPSTVTSVFQQLQEQIENFVKDPFAIQLKEKIVLCLLSLLKHAQEKEQVSVVNLFLWKMRSIVLSSNQGLWSFIVKNNVKLAGNKENMPTEAEQKKFCNFLLDKDSIVTPCTNHKTTDEADDLLDMLE